MPSATSIELVYCAEVNYVKVIGKDCRDAAATLLKHDSFSFGQWECKREEGELAVAPILVDGKVVGKAYSFESATIHLRNYLGPNGRHPYAELAPFMELLHSCGTRVHLVSVPGSLMGLNHFGEFAKEYPWSDLNGTDYKTATDLLSRKDGRVFSIDE